jgi:hypothetical protein
MNMAETTVSAGSAPARMNVFARFIGILTAPRATFENVVAHPAWLGMLCLTLLLAGFGAVLPTTTDAGKQAAIDQQVSFIEGMGMQVNDQMYAQFQKGAARLPYTTAASMVVTIPLAIVIISGILFAIFNAAMGGNARFKQLFAVLVHAGVIFAVGALFSGPINYARGSMSSATSLGAILPMLDEKSFIGRLAGMLDIFWMWWVIVISIGLGVLYRRKTQPIATGFFVLYAAIVLGVAAFMSR